LVSVSLFQYSASFIFYDEFDGVLHEILTTDFMSEIGYSHFYKSGRLKNLLSYECVEAKKSLRVIFYPRV